MEKELIYEWMNAGFVQIPNLLIKHYKSIGLNEKEFVLLLQIISFKEKGNEFPTPLEIADCMSTTSEECSQLLRQLLQKQVIQIENGVQNDIMYERYSLHPLWNKLIDLLVNEKKETEMLQFVESEKDLYSLFENEFGRPLSPLECETLGMWIDQDGQDPLLIKAALREAVISGTVNFRYIDRILFEWKKNNITTIEQVRVHSQKFRQKNKASERVPSTKTAAVPFYNWLDQ